MVVFNSIRSSGIVAAKLLSKNILKKIGAEFCCLSTYCYKKRDQKKSSLVPEIK